MVVVKVETELRGESAGDDDVIGAESAKAVKHKEWEFAPT